MQLISSSSFIGHISKARKFFIVFAVTALLAACVGIGAILFNAVAPASADTTYITYKNAQHYAGVKFRITYDLKEGLNKATAEIVGYDESATSQCGDYKNNPEIPESILWLYNGEQLVSVPVVGFGLQEGSTAKDEDPKYGFRSCTSLQSVDLSACSDKFSNEIPYGTFGGCTSLEKVVLPNTTTIIGAHAFDAKQDLGDKVDIKVTSKLTSFAKKDSTNKDTFATFTSIGDYAFANCWLLKFTSSNAAEETLNASNLTTLGKYAFSACTYLYSIDLTNANINVDNNKKSIIEEGTFNNCSNLTDVKLPTSLGEIGTKAFQYNSFTNIDLPEGLTIIEAAAFYSCTELTSITFPASLVDIYAAAFGWCSHLTQVNFPENSNLDYITFGQAPDGCTVNGAFEKSGLTSIVIPSGVGALGVRSFANCESLVSVTLPADGVYFWEYAFYNDPALIEVIFPEMKNQNSTSNAFFRSNDFACGTETTYCGTTTVFPAATYPEARKYIFLDEKPSNLDTCDVATITDSNTYFRINFSVDDNVVEVKDALKNSTVVAPKDGTDKVPTYNSKGSKFSSWDRADYSPAVKGMTVNAIYKGTFDKISIEGLQPSYYETGEAIVPKLTVKNNAVEPAITLTEGKDYKVECNNNIKIGTATAQVIGLGDYAGEKQQNTMAFSIVGDMTKAKIEGVKSMEETGSPVTQEGVVVKSGISGDTLTEGTDYQITYSNNTNPGTAAILIAGLGNWRGMTGQEFTIIGDISKVTVKNMQESYVETGEAITPEPLLVSVSNTALIKDTDYTLSYAANTEPGTATMTITGKDNWAKTKTVTFNITGDLEQATISGVQESYDANGSQITPTPTVTSLSGKTLVKDSDYILSYDENKNPGIGTIHVVGKEGSLYVGTEQYYIFKIIGDLATDAEITNVNNIYAYTGSDIEPTPIVKDKNSGSTISDSNYGVTYDSNKDEGTNAKVIVTANSNGYWKGTISKTFAIEKVDAGGDISKATISGCEASYLETGSDIVPDLDVVSDAGIELVKGVHYSVTCANNKNPGIATLTITGISSANWTGQQVITFQIKGDISKATVVGIEESYTETGSAITVKPTSVTGLSGATLTENTDYTVVCADSTTPGEKVVTIQGVGTYAGTKQDKNFVIEGDLSLAVVSGIEPNYKETGSDIVPSYRLTGKSGIALIEGIDYKRTDTASTAAVGAHTLSFEGMGNYTGTQTAEIKVVGDISQAIVTRLDEAYPATGSEIKPEPMVTSFTATTLVKDTDYTLSYKDNVAVGTATITITGKGNYEGVLTDTFKIAGDVSQAVVTGIEESYAATGKEIAPKPTTISVGTTLLVENKDYTIEYSDNTVPGTASIIITGIGNYTGTKIVNFEITGDINDAVVSGIEKSYEETGGQITPIPTVVYGDITLEPIADYSVTYENNIEPGTAKMTITGIGEYTGTKEVTFTITAKASTVSWERLAGGTALGTMRKIVNAGWETSDYAIVATNKSYQDALAAAGLAGLLNNAPVLMTNPDTLSTQTSELLQNKGVKNVIIVGGTSAVSDTVKDAIKNIIKNEPERIAGGTAVGTATKVYQKGIELGKTSGTTWGKDAIVATINSYQDALSIAPYAYAKHAPIFLTSKSKDITASVSTAINDGGFTRTLIVGGSAAVADSVDGKVVKAYRIAGATAYGTSKKIAEFAAGEGGMTTTHVGIACGSTYQDALAGAALCGKNNSILLLADDSKSKDHYSTATKYLATQKARLGKCYIFGGETAVSKTVADAIEAACK